jgi:hypothetical protein
MPPPPPLAPAREVMASLCAGKPDRAGKQPGCDAALASLRAPVYRRPALRSPFFAIRSYDTSVLPGLRLYAERLVGRWNVFSNCGTK